MMDLEELQGGIMDALEAFESDRKAAISDALRGGQLLNEAKARVKHGGWTAFVESCGMKGRTARRWMLVAEAGLDAGEVAHLGGLECTARLWRTFTAVTDADTVRAMLSEPMEHTIDWEGVAYRLPFDEDTQAFYSEMTGLVAGMVAMRRDTEELEAEIARLEALAG